MLREAHTPRWSLLVDLGFVGFLLYRPPLLLNTQPAKISSRKVKETSTFQRVVSD